MKCDYCNLVDKLKQECKVEGWWIKFCVKTARPEKVYLRVRQRGTIIQLAFSKRGEKLVWSWALHL